MNTVCPGGWTTCFGEHVLSMHMEAMSFLISTEDTGELMGVAWGGIPSEDCLNTTPSWVLF